MLSGCGDRKIRTLLWGMVNGAATVEKQLGVFSLTYTWNFIWLSNSTPRSTLERIENECSNKNLYTNVHSSTIYNNPKGEMTQMSVSGRMDKWVYPYNEILLNHKKVQSTDTYYDVMKLENTMLNEKLEKTVT